MEVKKFYLKILILFLVGLDYAKRAGLGGIDYCLYDTDSREEKKKKYLWGSYGKNAEHTSLVHKPLISLETDHLLNILRTQKQISEEERSIITEILDERGFSDDRGVGSTQKCFII
jgi:hypothetical protein